MGKWKLRRGCLREASVSLRRCMRWLCVCLQRGIWCLLRITNSDLTKLLCLLMFAVIRVYMCNFVFTPELMENKLIVRWFAIILIPRTSSCSVFINMLINWMGFAEWHRSLLWQHFFQQSNSFSFYMGLWKILHTKNVFLVWHNSRF